MARATPGLAVEKPSRDGDTLMPAASMAAMFAIMVTAAIPLRSIPRCLDLQD
jgi:hypothetical protein